VIVVEHLIADHRASGGIAIVASHQPIAMTDATALDLREYPW